MKRGTYAKNLVKQIKVRIDVDTSTFAVDLDGKKLTKSVK
jgi:hypothetical protein